MGERIKTTNGTIIYKNEYSVYHREDGPAIIHSDGTEFWYKNGKRHREDGPAVINSDGTEELWYRNGKLHREDGPAVINSEGTEEWWLNGKFHRKDGPAVIFPDGEELWYLNGANYSFNEWIKLIGISKEVKMELILRYG